MLLQCHPNQPITVMKGKQPRDEKSNVNPRGNLNLPLFPLIAGHTIAPSRCLGPTPIRTSRLLANHDILDAELKPRVLRVNPFGPLLAALLSSALPLHLDTFFLLHLEREALSVLAALVRVVHAVTLVRDEVRVRDTCVCGLEDLRLVVALTNAFDAVGFLRGLGDGCAGVVCDFLDDGVGEARGAGEDAAGVDAGELAGFGDGVEDLGVRQAVDREVVYGFVGFLVARVRGVGGCWDHFLNGAGIWESQWFSLVVFSQLLMLAVA